QLSVLANGAELHNGDRFQAAPAITFQASDDRPGVNTTLTVDGASGSNALSNLRDGGHTLTALARDAAGNETRVDRTFVIGSGGASACVLSNFDPADRSAIFANSVKLAGRAAGATSVIVNGVRAYVADGTFAVHVQLPLEGANAITIACGDSAGVARTDGQTTLTLFRTTGAPSITIEAPSRNAIAATESVVVSGTVGSDVLSGDVNGVPFTPVGGRYSLSNIALASGANIITARARNGAGRVGIVTTYVIRPAVPRIAITSPLPSMQTGASSIDVSGTYTNVDPSTLSMTAHAISDTTGTFTGSAALLTNGSTTITVTGRSLSGVSASTSVDFQNTAGLPTISIDTPSNETTFGASQSEIAVSGTISPVGGAVVQINGSQVTVDAASHFSRSVALQSGVTPVLARILTPDGKTSSDNIRVLRLASGLRIKETFPSVDAQQVDAGVLLLVLFSNPIDAASARGAVALVDSAGQQVTTTLYIANDVISIAPAIPLTSGAKYTLNISTLLKDVAGSGLSQPFTLS
ncbi:MAG TPA: Ig-like domain-containing protein, partial [Thermoanaerobaculia bacterium]